MICEGDQLEINVSSADGAIQAEVLTEGGEVIAGYERSSSLTFSGDSLRREMRWQKDRNLSSLRGQRIRLKFYLSNAVLYSFQIKSPGSN